MNKSSNHNVVAVIALAAAGCSVQVTPKQPDAKPSTTATKAAVAVQPPSTIAQADLKAAATDPATTAFYAANGWQAAWSPDTARALDEALDQRPRDGLDHVNFGSPDAHGDAAHADVQRTRVALAYAAALAHGVVDPTTLHKVYTIPRPDLNLDRGLTAALRAGTVGAWFNGLPPQDADYRKLSAAYLSYRKSAPAAAAKPAIPDAKTIHPGDHDPRVSDIANQLTSEGYLPAATAGQTSDDAYTQPIADAVKHLQTDYGIKPDGTIGSDTLEVLNQGADDKARALAVAMERRRWLSRTPPATRIDVNTAAATLSYYRDGKLVDRRAVIAGKPDKETPPLAAPLYRLVANPTWTVPKSIKVSAATIRNEDMHRRGGFLVQPSGPKNALGLVKFDLKDDQEIYLHDTNDHSLFARVQRHLSHGCVRVQDALGFAQSLAQQEGILSHWQQARQSGKEAFVTLPQPIPVRLLYWNAFVDANGQISFRTDPYAWNPPVAKALGFAPQVSARPKPDDIDLGP